MPPPSLVAPLLLAAFATPTRAQTVLFAEDFDLGIPAAWTQLHVGPHIDPWHPGVSIARNSPDVWHEAFCTNGFTMRNNVLMTPPIDLSGFAQADLAFVQEQLLPTRRFYNGVEVTTNGGQTFQTLYVESTTVAGTSTVSLDLDAYAGLPDVRIAFRYRGTVANEWRIDEVRVTTPQPVLEVTNLVGGGTATFALRGMTPANFALLGLSLTGSGPLPTPHGTVNLSLPVSILAILFGDANGQAAFNLPIPASVIGLPIWCQAGEHQLSGVFAMSNWVGATVQ